MWFNIIIISITHDAFFAQYFHSLPSLLFLPDLPFCLCSDLYRTTFTPLVCGCGLFEPNSCLICGGAVAYPHSRKLPLLTLQNGPRKQHTSQNLGSDMGCHGLYVSQVIASVSQDIARFYWFVLNPGFIGEVYRKWRYTARHLGRT